TPDAGDASDMTRRYPRPTRAQQRPAAAASNPPDNDNARGTVSLADFAAAVVQATRAPGVRRFHDDRAFIGSLWENMRGRAPVGDMPLAHFKERLIEAHRNQLLRMSRADLIAAMDPAEVARSEARYLESTFHFVALDTAEAS
ncbi:MAG: hypothetical protein ABW321_33705, partial [Polyangiales bacterium]